jgi:predicted Zn-dependent peptidase
MEKKVIINEIGRYEDQPMWSAYDHARRLHFGEHRLGNSVLGTVQSITDLSRDQMQAYFERRYVAGNIIVAVAGHLDWPAFVELIERHCGAWQDAPAGRDCLREAPGTGKFELRTKEKVTQEYVVMMSQGPAADSPLRHASDLLGMAVGDDSGSRLYWELIDPGLADSADCSFHESEGTGVFLTSFSGEPEQAEENLEIVRRVLAEVREGGITEEELTQARNKMLSRIVRSSERPKGRMVALGMNWIYQHDYRSVDDELASYEKVTVADVRAVLDRYPLDRVTTLALGPLTALAPAEGNGRR